MSESKILVGAREAVARWCLSLKPGALDRGGRDTGQRVISTRAAIKSFTSTDSGNLGNYIGIVTIKPFINSGLILAAGVTDRLWSMEDVAAIVENAAPKAGKRGPYKKTAAQIPN